jgi:CheY-like chemotaxis protein
MNRAELGESGPSGSMPRSSDRSGGHATILVVEDDDGVRGVLRRALLAAGYRVLEASTGPAALDIAEHHGPTLDAIVADIQLPRLSGVDLIRAVRQWRPDIRVLLISGEIVEIEALLGLADTPTAYLAKPFRPPELVNALRELLDRSA